LKGIIVDSVTKTFKTKGVKIFGKVTIAVKREKTVKALDGISLEIKPGESVGIIGPNGAGKSTLMGCLLGFIQPDSGSVTIDDKSPNDLDVRRTIGYVPERLNFHGVMTILELLRFHYDLADQLAADAKQRIEELLTLVGLEKQKWDLPVEKCSRGMLQRIAIAQALVGKPQYLFLDEPTSGIDPGGVIELTKLLLLVKNQGITLVLNSHQLDQVEKICDRTLFVRQGSLRAGAEDTQIQPQTITIRFARVTEGLSQQLEILSSEIGIPLQTHRHALAEFLVNGDEACERLITALVTAGLPVVEAVPQHTRLEQLFLDSTDEEAHL
jgi:ABC-2 type transport system ATP-binding protein